MAATLATKNGLVKELEVCASAPRLVLGPFYTLLFPFILLSVPPHCLFPLISPGVARRAAGQQWPQRVVAGRG